DSSRLLLAETRQTLLRGVRAAVGSTKNRAPGLRASARRYETRSREGAASFLEGRCRCILRFVVSSSCLGQSPTTDFPILELGDGRHLGDLHWNLVATEPLSAPLSDGAIGNRLIGDELQSNLLVAERVGSLKDHCVSYAGHLKDDLFDLGWIDLETRNVDHI